MPLDQGVMWRLVVEALGLALPNGAKIKGWGTSSSRRKRFLRDLRQEAALFGCSGRENHTDSDF